MAVESSTRLKFECHCKSIAGTAQVPTISLPLPLGICHCKTCTLATGQLCATVVRLPQEARFVVDRGTVKCYDSGRLHRFFCRDCGSSVYEADPEGQLFLDSGAIKVARTQDGLLLFEAKYHIFVGDTTDGGARDFMMELPAWEEWQETSRRVSSGSLYGPSRPPEATLSTTSKDERLHCGCHCGGVSFSISRPNEASARAIVKEHLDLLVPWSEPASRRPNVGNEPFWLRDQQTKYIAGLCVCDDCRTASGHEVQAWAWIPYVNVHVEHRGTLKRYKGSDRAWREFCGKCGATAFFGTEEKDGAREIVDVSVGLMQAASGTRAEDWLDWETSRVSYEDKCDNMAFAQVLSSGLRKMAWHRVN